MGELVDRTLRDWLEPSDDQPSRLSLTAGMDDNDTILRYDPAMVGAEEVELLAAGTLIEVGSEEMLVTDVDEDANRLVVTRGVNGTLAQDHDADDFVIPNPLWRRRVLFDALADGVVQLWPDLYQVRTSEAFSTSTSSSAFTEVPEDDADLVRRLMWWRSANGLTTIPLSDGDLLDEFPGSSTGKAFMVPGGCGGSGYLTYKACFARPEDEEDDLVDFGVPSDWEMAVMVGAVAYLVAGRELDLATQERLSKQLEQANYTAGTPSKIRDALLRFRSYLIDQAKAGLQARYPATVSMRGQW